MQKTLLLFLLFSIAANAGFPDDCTGPLTEVAREEAAKVACNAMDIAAQIWENKDIVPPRIYHFGKAEVVQKDVAARTVPLADWNNSIMGSKGRRFPLTPIRRGLYGTYYIDTNTFGGDGYFQMIEIHIKDECRRPEKVATLQNLEKDPKFVAWLGTQKKLKLTPEKFAGQCVKLDYVQGFGKECNAIVEKFLKDADIKVIQDSVINKSFYVRDRNCIATIRGSNSELIDSFARYPALLFDSCNTHFTRGAEFYLQELITKSVSTEKFSVETLQNLQANSRLVRDRTYINREKFIRAVDTFIDCKTEQADADCREKVKRVFQP